jgi:hypothetical protein
VSRGDNPRSPIRLHRRAPPSMIAAVRGPSNSPARPISGAFGCPTTSKTISIYRP